ncbi:hypothetical protein DM860_009952 [Cuscuta australis]|uniref:Uncharacterized protein n=1 Tax=Cuscuta australis TaxID=267555 RepID=A0A328DD57_9ASTE|nr:hypothetical protein DM860_009952 [Cuscuta australis]
MNPSMEELGGRTVRLVDGHEIFTPPAGSIRYGIGRTQVEYTPERRHIWSKAMEFLGEPIPDHILKEQSSLPYGNPSRCPDAIIPEFRTLVRDRIFDVFVCLRDLKLGTRVVNDASNADLKKAAQCFEQKLYQTSSQSKYTDMTVAAWRLAKEVSPVNFPLKVIYDVRKTQQDYEKEIEHLKNMIQGVTASGKEEIERLKKRKKIQKEKVRKYREEIGNLQKRIHEFVASYKDEVEGLWKTMQELDASCKEVNGRVKKRKRTVIDNTEEEEEEKILNVEG